MTAPIPKRGRPRKPYNPDEPKKTVKDECVFYPDHTFRLQSGNHTGKRRGKLTYLYFVGHHYIRGNYWLAQCECGKEVVTLWGYAKSCGCTRAETMKRNHRLGIKKTIDGNTHDDGLPELSKFVKPSFDRLTHCTVKRATYREMCRHYIECQDERVFGKKKVSSRYANSCGNCYEVPVDDGNLGNLQRLILAAQ